MARSRVIKPEFWSDEKLSKLSRDARLTYIGLWGTCDDYAVTKAHPSWLKGQIFPYDDIKLSVFQSWVDELAKIGRIIPFTENDEQYYYIPGFSKHQKVDHPSTVNRNPMPPKDILETRERLATLSEHLREPSRESRAQTETETEVKLKHKGAIPPLIEDVRLYCKERSKGVDADTWYDHYEAKGWCIGKNRMIDWKAAVRTWEHNGKKESPLLEHPTVPDKPKMVW